MKFSRASSLLLATGAIGTGGAAADFPAAPSPAHRPLNVLMIAVDDLRLELACYGVPGVHTPNIDALAARGMVFERAYCQQAVCSPSRTSFMTGLRPDTTRVYDLATHFRDTVPDAVTIAELFKKNSYQTQAVGKIFHGPLDDPQSWTRPWLQGVKTPARDSAAARSFASQRAGVAPGREKVRWPHPSWNVIPADQERLFGDCLIADSACKVIAELRNQPFFLAVGFRKPHLPFRAPQHFFDLYPPETIHLPANGAHPTDVAPPSLHDYEELRAYPDIPKGGPIPLEKQRELIRAYRATVSFIDEQVGRVLRALDDAGLRDNTLVVFWGDHGFLLGEYGLWCKHTNLETATRCPLIFAGPGVRPGARTAELAEFVDVYPTLADFAGLAIPPAAQGVSLRAVLGDPSAHHKDFAISQYPRDDLMGYSIRTRRHRYTAWFPAQGFNANLTAAPVSDELYDMEIDPFETTNIRRHPDQTAIAGRLLEKLRASVSMNE
jgi:iduronate 2-sulfatase